MADRDIRQKAGAQIPVTRVFNRYELLEELPQTSGGRLFRARDLAFAETVEMRFFDAEHQIPPEHRHELETIVRRCQSFDHPHLRRIYAFSAAGGWLVREWIPGVSILDLLRKRRNLALLEVVSILDALPATLDLLIRENTPAPPDLLRKLFVQFEGTVPTDTVISGPVSHWPRFVVKLDALNLRSWMTTRSVDDTTHLVLPAVGKVAEIGVHELSAPRNFARLLYELLGGRIMELHTGRYSPIGVLGESGNSVLQRALLDAPFSTCEALWEAILATQPSLQSGSRPQPVVTEGSPVGRHLEVPPTLLGSAAKGAVLDLIPHRREATPIRLVARDRFAIGRSFQQADFPTRILPENEDNNSLTKRLSRVHVLLTRNGSDPEARDGHGNGPSLNGSSLNGIPLAADRPSRIAGRSLLWLGAEYAVELIPAAGAQPWKIGNVASWKGSLPDLLPDLLPEGPEVPGGLICLPKDGNPAARHAAWIFTEIGFGLDASDGLVWDTRGRTSSPASFHHCQGQFWLSNRSLSEDALACGDTALQRNQIAPLVHGQVVRIGSQEYTVNLE